MNKFAVAVIILPLFLLGCGQQATLTGSATYNGELIESGGIAFYPVGGSTNSFGGKIVGGNFVIDKFNPGKHRVVVRGTYQTSAPTTREEAEKKAAAAKAAGGKAYEDYLKQGDYIAEDAPGNSQEFEITQGGEPLEIKITGPPK